MQPTAVSLPARVLLLHGIRRLQESGRDVQASACQEGLEKSDLSTAFMPGGALKAHAVCDTAANRWPRQAALFSALPGLRFRRCEDFAEQREDFRDAEGLLQEAGCPPRRSFRAGIGQLTAHIDDSGLRRTGGGEDLRGSFAAVDKKAARREMQIAEKNVVRAAPPIASLARRALCPVSSRLAIGGKALKERECFFGGGGAVHAEPLRGEAFVQQLAQAFFVV